MTAQSRQAAQQRADRLALFRAELTTLEDEGGLTLTPEQQAGLDAHIQDLLARWRTQYGIDATDSARRVSWGMRIASLLGAAALVAAAILFLHRIWGYLGTPVQLLILTLAPLAMLLGAELTHRRNVDSFYVGLFAIAAEVAIITELSALGAVLNLSGSPHVLLTWGAFALCLAYAYGLRLLLAAGLLLLGAWSGAVILEWTGYVWMAFLQSSRLLIPGAIILYALPSLGRPRGGHGPAETPPRHSHDAEAFATVYRLCGAGLGLLALLILSLGGDHCCGSISPTHVAAAYQITGILLALGVVAHGLRLGASPLVNLGAAGFVIFLFARLQAWWWEWMPKYLFFLVLGLIAFGLLLVFRRIRARLAQGALA